MRPMRLSCARAWVAAQDAVNGLPPLPATSDTGAEQPSTETGAEPWWAPHERPGRAGGNGSIVPWGDY